MKPLPLLPTGSAPLACTVMFTTAGAALAAASEM